jgi:hypothetical protein
MADSYPDLRLEEGPGVIGEPVNESTYLLCSGGSEQADSGGCRRSCDISTVSGTGSELCRDTRAQYKCDRRYIRWERNVVAELHVSIVHYVEAAKLLTRAIP